MLCVAQACSRWGSQASRLAVDSAGETPAGPTDKMSVLLKIRLAHIARPSFEACELLQERERNLANRTIALFRDNKFGFACFFRACLFVLLVDFRPDKQPDQVRVLFDRAGFAQIAQSGFTARALLWLSIQLRHYDDWNFQFLG